MPGKNYITAIFCALLAAQTTVAQVNVFRPGLLDLRSHNFDTEIIDLDGEWLYSPEVLLSPIETAAGPLQQPASAPAAFGTLTVRLLLPEHTPALGLRTPLIGTAFSVYANGHYVGGCGKVGSTPESAESFYRPLLLPLPDAPGREIFLSLRYSNFIDLKSGVYYPIRLGSMANLAAERESAATNEALLFGALLLIGIYHLGYFFFRIKNRAPLWFGLFTLCIALRSLFYSELLALNFWPGLSFDFILRAVHIFVVLPSAFVLLFFSNLYPSLNVKGAKLLGVGLPLLYTAAWFVLPAAWAVQGLYAYQIFMLTAGLFLIIQLIRALRRGLPGAILFLLGIAAFLHTVILDILKTNFGLPLPSLVAWGTIALILMHGFVIIRQFSLSYQKAEDYSEHLVQLNTSLERFIPKEILGLLAKTSILQVDLGDFTQRKMTVYFLDIRNFTALSESMTPEQNFRFINSFLKQFGPVIRDCGGFVDKYLGDGFLALFPESPSQALRAALRMRSLLLQYNQHRSAMGYKPIAFGIGIHTGPLMLGTIGENLRMDSTVISDTVNIASRLEGLTKKFQTDILVSGETYAAVVESLEFDFRFLGSETVKGKTIPIEVWQVLGEKQH